ncbi:DUF1178 family protein [Qipengyuania sp. XHP0207]|uniref:DUF1178 family protein n=1 Tax=Qipengyuania sp. XHP0207 TaxID=3038078 RepID=UPI00241FAC2C|nr:DUF1178 family protein [Qipengyuania sp. XHP0207]MDG5747524.1 DUF1178 family protein [Qipengyuania sp. XHP0207]
MIVYDLSCIEGHRFEGWFGSSADFEAQRERGLVSCPECGCSKVAKAPMAPAVSSKSNSGTVVEGNSESAGSTTPIMRGELPAEVRQAVETLAKAQAKALKSSTWVGEKFAEQARSMHYGEADEAPIHGKATKDEAEEMLAEGIAVAPLLFPVAPPDELN